MASDHMDIESLREVFVYLYRCWIEKYLAEVPSELALSPSDGLLITPSLSLYFSTDTPSGAVIAELREKLDVPTAFIAPRLPPSVIGVSNLANPGNLPEPFDRIFTIIRNNLDWLGVHRERGLSQREIYKTEEYGDFALWKGRSATRLLLQPANAILYGYAVIQNAPKDYFFRRSKSCKEEGSKIAKGRYKRCQHRVEKRDLLNIDLQYSTGEVLLLHLALAGAGYKVFPRETPEPEPHFPY